MAYISVDVDIGEFPKKEIAAYVAMNDDLWQLCQKLRAAEMEKRAAGPIADRAGCNRLWREAVEAGLIADVSGRTL
jgi:hypothetical protein